MGKDTDRDNVFTNDWLGTKGFDALDGEFYYDTIKVNGFKHALSLGPTLTPKFDYKYYGKEKENEALKAAMAAKPPVPADVYEKEHKIGKYADTKEGEELRKEAEKEEKKKKEKEEKEKEKKEKEEKEKEEEAKKADE